MKSTSAEPRNEAITPILISSNIDLMKSMTIESRNLAVVGGDLPYNRSRQAPTTARIVM
jgi:hypothetical protein